MRATVVLVVTGVAIAGSIYMGQASAAPATLPDAVRLQLRDVFQITADDPAPGAPGPAITSQDAVSIARNEFDFVGGGPPTAYLANMTDIHSGRVIGTHHPGTPALFAPTAVNRQVWVVVIPNAEIPVFGPPNGNTQTALPRSFVGALCVFVDASTGEYFKAVGLKT